MTQSREQELRELVGKWEKEADAIPQAWANEARVYRGCAVQLRAILAQPEKLAVMARLEKVTHDFVEEFCGGSEAVEEVLYARIIGSI